MTERRRPRARGTAAAKAPSGPPPALSTDGLAKSYGDVAALAPLDLRIKTNQAVVLIGHNGSGKTTTLNVLSSFIPNDERIVTIEDAAELQLRQEHVVTLESRPPNIEGKGAIPIRELVRNSLRMRPDRIIVG